MIIFYAPDLQALFRYLECNPGVVGANGWFQSQDSVHTLTCAIMLLNTDVHGAGAGSGSAAVSGHRKMTSAEFVENLSELNDGRDFPKDLLKNIYYSIKSEPIPWAQDEDDQETLPQASPESNQQVWLITHNLSSLFADINVVSSFPMTGATQFAPANTAKFPKPRV